MSVHRIQVPELVVPGKPLGRHIHIDDRSEAYPAEQATALRSVTHSSGGLPLDQGQIGSCTANALVGALNTVPHWKPGQPLLAEPDAVRLYSQETALEGDPYPPNDPGGSGTEVCKAGKQAGLLDGYQHATTVEQALAALVIRPVITGVNWYSSFDTPNPEGLVAISSGAYVRGGHEFVAVGLDVAAELVWFVNSWGLGWGVPFADIPGGCFAMSFNTWARLLAQGGDCTIPRTRLGWIAQPISA